MFKLNLYYYIFQITNLFFLAFISCNSIKTEDLIPSINVPYKISKENVLLDYFSLPYFVKLETNDDCLLGNVKKVIKVNNKIYVLETRVSKGVYVFNGDGKYLYRIGQIGKGPGEYGEPCDFYIDDNHITILDKFAKRTLSYDLNGKFIKENKLPFNCLSIEKFDDYFLLRPLVSGGNIRVKNRFKFYIWNEFKISDRFIEAHKEQEGDFSLSNPFLRIGDYITYTEAFNDTIYRFIKGDISSKIYVDFGRKKLSKKFKNLTLSEKINKISSPEMDKRLFINNSFETNNFIYFSFLSKEGKYNCIYNKTNDSTYIFDKLPAIDDKLIKGVINAPANSGTVYSVIFPESDVAEVFNMEVYDNPCLLFFNLIN